MTINPTVPRAGRRGWPWVVLKILAIAGGGLGALVALLAIVYWQLGRDLPDAKTLAEYRPPLPTTIVSKDGEILTLFARQRRIYTSIEDVPPRVVQAFISAEDKTFFEHSGLDYPGIAKAAFNLIRIKLTGSDKRPAGASTITQQVAQAILLGRKFSYTRKVRDMILARRIEQALPKDRILELYLNQIFMGRNSYGVTAASFAYFNRPLNELTLPEVAFLAALPKGPSLYNPVTRKALTIERRNYVLDQMAANGYISAQEHDQAVASDLVVSVPRVQRVNRLDTYYLEDIRRRLIDRFGEERVYNGGLWVYTTIDFKLQRAAERAMRRALLNFDRGKDWNGPEARIDPGEGWQRRLAALDQGADQQLKTPRSSEPPRDLPYWPLAMVTSNTRGVLRIGFANGLTGVIQPGSALRRLNGQTALSLLKPGDVVPVEPVNVAGGQYVLRQIPQISGGFVAQDPQTGHILALVGGFDARRSAFNRATQAMRQPGSAFKPFVYAVGLDNGYTPASLIVDGPFCVNQGVKLGNKCFRNFDGRISGARTLRDALEKSRNLVTVRLAHTVGMQKVADYAKQVGIVDNMRPLLAYALGAGETTVERLVNAYATLDNGGVRLEPTTIDRVEDSTGAVIYRSDDRTCANCNAPDWTGAPMPTPTETRPQVVDPRTAYQIVHMLEGVVERGTATRLRYLDRPLAGKTGTTNEATNVWYVGMTPYLVAGLYLGYDTPRPLGGWAQGGTVAAPVWGEFADYALKDEPKTPFRAAPGVRMVRVDRRSGRIVQYDGPGVIWEAFKPGNEPRTDLQPTKPLYVQSDADFANETGGVY
ncbi:MAG: PBP1A family penicillin-binding protein [Sphingomonadales bacterium]|nr:MAG: PBP1A family penicillin-binding protein [Sphingomonadales bacterium]